MFSLQFFIIHFPQRADLFTSLKKPAVLHNLKKSLVGNNREFMFTCVDPLTVPDLILLSRDPAQPPRGQTTC